MSSDVAVKVSGLYKLFGPTPEKFMDQVLQGKSKTEILAETGHTLGLTDINLEIKKGEIFVIMGLSGSGKSTLIRHFNRLIEPTKGELNIHGVDIMQLGEKDLRQFRRDTMSMVFQHFGLFPHYSVLDNVAFGLKTSGMGKDERQERARKWLKTVGLEGYEDQYPNQLSGGQQQRVGLARALCTDVDILLMDEAFSALDPLIRSEMQDQLISLQEQLHKTIIFITHDLDEALRLGDRIAILRDGELVQVGTPVEVLLEPADDYVEAFVRDVNRARALTVETVMKPPKCRITSDTISEALKQMRINKSEYAFYENEEGYQGAVLKETLEQVISSSGDQPLEEHLIDCDAALSLESPIEDVLPDTISSEYPLPVVNEEGELEGQLSRQRVVSVLSIPAEKA